MTQSVRVRTEQAGANEPEFTQEIKTNSKHWLTPLRKGPFKRHSWKTFWGGTLVQHFCLTLLSNTLLKGPSWRDTLVGRSCKTHLWDTFVGHNSPRPLLRIRQKLFIVPAILETNPDAPSAAAKGASSGAVGLPHRRQGSWGVHSFSTLDSGTSKKHNGGPGIGI